MFNNDKTTPDSYYSVCQFSSSSLPAAAKEYQCHKYQEISRSLWKQQKTKLKLKGYICTSYTINISRTQCQVCRNSFVSNNQFPISNISNTHIVHTDQVDKPHHAPLKENKDIFCQSYKLLVFIIPQHSLLLQGQGKS